MLSVLSASLCAPLCAECTFSIVPTITVAYVVSVHKMKWVFWEGGRIVGGGIKNEVELSY